MIDRQEYEGGVFHAHDVISHDQVRWDGTFYRMALEMAQMSKDPRRKVGALVVSANRRQIAPGYNGFPPSVPDRVWMLNNRDECAKHMVHAEANALSGDNCPFNTEDATLYVTRFPCRQCADLVVKRGIGRVVAPKPDVAHPRWGISWAQSLGYLSESCCTIKFIDEARRDR